jgi:hypothetical protein
MVRARNKKKLHISHNLIQFEHPKAQVVVAPELLLIVPVLSDFYLLVDLHK